MSEVIIIPDQITVHLGPPDAPASNMTLVLSDYLKRIVSDSVCPLWHESALRAIICSQLSFALNRLHKNYYRGMGYGFDITGDPGFDQRFIPGGCVFENINRFVDEASDVYIAHHGSAEPLQTVYRPCNEKISGILTAETAKELADEGLSALEILQTTFGSDIELVRGEFSDGCVYDQTQKPLMLGSSGREVADVQRRLNLISTSFPNIPKINPADGMYGPGTEAAVKEFQRTFNMTVDGSVGYATRRRIRQVYDTVRKMLRLNSELMSIPATCAGKDFVLSEGDSGDSVKLAQHLLNFAALYNCEIKPVKDDGMYRGETTESVVDFQRAYNLPLTGDVDCSTYDMLYDVYYGIQMCRSGNTYLSSAVPYPGAALRFGIQSPDVKQLQTYLNCAADLYSDVLGKIKVTGVFGSETRTAVKALQRINHMPQTGIVIKDDWEMITALCDDCAAASYLIPGQFPGYLIERKAGREVRY